MKSTTFINISFVKTFNHICKKNHLHLRSYRSSRGSLWWAHTSNHFGHRKKKNKVSSFFASEVLFSECQKLMFFFGKKSWCLYSFDWKLRWSLQIWFLDDNFPIQDSPTAMSWKWLARRAYRPAIFYPTFFAVLLGRCCCMLLAIKWIAFPHCSRKIGGNLLGAFQSVCSLQQANNMPQGSWNGHLRMCWWCFLQIEVVLQ